ncbi:MAG TPA: nucleotidyltransferase domain-containing protein [archaeon]|nr:nucleotidyltransferase domain-containing protein [archaeon]
MVAAVSDLRNKIIPVLKKNGVKKAALFGSTARGEAKKGSDVDILVQLGRKESLFDVIRLKLALEKKLKKGVDLVEYAAIKPALREYILKDEVPIL